MKMSATGRLSTGSLGACDGPTQKTFEESMSILKHYGMVYTSCSDAHSRATDDVRKTCPKCVATKELHTCVTEGRLCRWCLRELEARFGMEVRNAI